MALTANGEVSSTKALEMRPLMRKAAIMGKDEHSASYSDTSASESPWELETARGDHEYVNTGWRQKVPLGNFGGIVVADK